MKSRIKQTNQQKIERREKFEYGKHRRSYEKREELEMCSICNKLDKQQTLVLKYQNMNISKDWDNVLGITNEYSDAKIKTPPTTTLADTSEVPNKIMLVLLNMK